jgi:hypothetical protein
MAMAATDNPPVFKKFLREVLICNRFLSLRQEA